MEVIVKDKIINVPVEMVMKIVKYIPKRYWRDMAGVNRCFYGVICDLEKNGQPLVITETVVSV